MSVQPIPKGYHSVNASLMVRDANRVIDFLKQAFGATEKERHLGPDGSIMHAALTIGDSIVMLGEAGSHCQPTTAGLYVYVPNADETFQRALQAGATKQMDLADQFWGDRGGSVKDPAGNSWWIATHKEDVSAEELKRRMEKFFSEQQQQKKAA